MAIPPADYKYDVFLSYKRNTLIYPWVTIHFFNMFKDWLTEDLNSIGKPDPRIFFDDRNIEPGQIWPIELQNAVKTSKVMVAICSPSYFQSSWCTSEWESFKERQDLLQINSLIIPVRHNDCENHLADIQYSDFSSFTILAREFYQRAEGVAFEEKIKALTKVVAKAIDAAPSFRHDWPLLNISPSKHAPAQLQRL